MRILGIDFGEKRIGLAMCDPLEFTAQGLETLKHENKRQILKALSDLCRMHGVEEVVIGLPINMDGSEGPKAREVRTLIPELEKILAIPVKPWDERLSSRQADRLMVRTSRCHHLAEKLHRLLRFP